MATVDDDLSDAPIVVDGVPYYDSDDIPAGGPVAIKPYIKRERAGRPPMISEQVISKVLQAIRLGTFAHIAAQAAGISPPTFYRYLRQGRQPIEEYRENPTDAERAEHALMVDLANGVETAKAQARMKAEQAVFETKPGAWLRLGPGRDQGNPDEPGWTSPTNGRGGHRSKVTHNHAHLHVTSPAIDLSKLSTAELQQLERLTSRILPAKATDPIDVPATD